MSTLVFNVFVDKRADLVNDVGDGLFLSFAAVFPFGVFDLKLLSISFWPTHFGNTRMIWDRPEPAMASFMIIDCSFC
jgi:hypothetical protein